MPFPIAAALGGAALGGTLGGGLSSLFQKNPSDAASGYLNRIPDTIKPYLEPYINRGNAAYDVLNPQYTNMATNPVNFLNSLMEQYQPSRGYQLRRDEALQTAGNTAAAGGMRGSLNDISQESRLTDALLGEDMQQWLQNVLGIQGAGISGQQAFYNQGADSAHTLAGGLATNLGAQGQLAYQGQQFKNQQMAQLFNMLGSLGGAGLGAWAGGGGGGGNTTGGNAFTSSSMPNRYGLGLSY